jgi:predicted porin
MKKVLFGVAVFGTLASAAHAQSSVTSYGIIDEGINYNSNMNGSRSYAMQSGVSPGKPLGLQRR